MDQICIKKLEIFARHGVLPEENTLGQKFLVTATLYGDTSKAGRSDALEDSINYAEVSQLVKEITEKQVFKLIETLAEQIAEGILLAYPKLCKVDIEVEKPWAPVLLPLETVSVNSAVTGRCCDRSRQTVFFYHNCTCGIYRTG